MTGLRKEKRARNIQPHPFHSRASSDYHSFRSSQNVHFYDKKLYSLEDCRNYFKEPIVGRSELFGKEIIKLSKERRNATKKCILLYNNAFLL